MESKQENDGKTYNADDEPEIEEHLKCGYWSWRPSCLQRFNTPRFLLVCIMWTTFTQGKVYLIAFTIQHTIILLYRLA